MKKVHIQIVEDEILIAEDLKGCLKGLGYAVSDSATSGEEAIRKAEENHPELVLMDIGLNGDMDGVEAAAQIRARFDIPVVYLTAYADKKTLERAKITEPFGYVLKPFDEKELNSNIEMALQKHKSERALRAAYRFLEISNDHKKVIPLLKEFVKEVRKFSRCAAAGIRLLDDEGKIGYHSHEGFNQKIYESEKPISLESDCYLCIDIMNGKIEPDLPFYTERGSFYTNCTRDFLAAISDEEKLKTCSACRAFGYESIALIPVRSENRTLCLIHIADPQKDMIPLEIVDVLERVAMQLGMAIQRIWVEEKLEASRKTFHNIVEKNADGILVTDRQGVIRFVNKAAELIFNHKANGLVGELFGFPVTVDDVAEIDILSREGKKGTGEMRVVETEWEDEPANLISIRDISERKRVEMVVKENEVLKKLDRLKSDFLSTVSHELRTPIAIMREGVSLCLDGIAGEITQTQRELLSATLESIDRLARLVTDLLDVSKIEAGKIQLKRNSVDLCQVVKNVCHDYENQVSEKGILMNMDLPEEALKLYVDADKITQIFTNLVSNAVRYVEKGEEIRIRLEDKEDVVECRVSDTGIGIAEENIHKVFSKFEQFGRVNGPGYKGTGLGLVIAKGLVEKHGGEIWVESELGKGTTFGFTLEKVSFPKILIVDDDSSVVHILKRFLSVDNYRSIEACNGEEAIVKAREENPSLIVLDMNLPGMSGYEVIGRLKQDKRTEKVPILISSGYEVNKEQLEKVNSHEAIPIVNKPMKSEELLEKVRELIVA